MSLVVANVVEDVVPYESYDIYDKLKEVYKNIFIGYSNDSEKNKIDSDNLVYFNKILCLNKEDEKYLRYLFSQQSKIQTNFISYNFV